MHSVKKNVSKPSVYAGGSGKCSVCETLQNYIVMGSRPTNITYATWI